MDHDNGDCAETGTRVLFDDIFRLVLDLLSAPPGLLVISTQSLLERPWILHLRTLKSFMFVCKRWYMLCIRYVYRDICIRSVGQLPALVCTIRDSPSYATWIRSLRFICYIPDAYMRVCVTSMQYLFDNCHSLQEVAFEEMVAPERIFTMLREAARDTEFPRLPSTVNSLSWVCQFTDPREESDPCKVPVPIKLISMLPNLVRLNMHGFTQNEYIPDVVHLPKLRTLCVYTADTFHLPDTWDLPSLIDFRVRTRLVMPVSPGITKCANLAGFFDGHGQKLRYVDLGHSLMEWWCIDTIVKACPQLYHLVFTLPLKRRHHDNPPLPQIAYVDMFTHSRRVGEQPPRGLFQVKNIRLLDRTLLAFVPDLPTLFSPEDSLQLDPKKVRFTDTYGLRINQGRDAVWMAAPYTEDGYSDLFRVWNGLEIDKPVLEDAGSSTLSYEGSPPVFGSRASSDCTSDEEDEDSGENGPSEEEIEEEVREELKWILEDNLRDLQPMQLPHDFQVIQIDEVEALARFSETVADD